MSQVERVSNNEVNNKKEKLLIKNKKNIVFRYLSCLGMEEEEEENKGKPMFLRFLLREHWTDGTLISLKTDIFAGVTLAVAQVAPCLAFALMGHGEPLVGLFSSFFLGIIPCVFGGRPGQITAIAGAVVVLYPDLVDKHGYGAVCAVSVISGCFMLLPGIFRIASWVRLLPASLMVGFCNGLALSMVIHQIPSFKDEEGEFVTGWRAFYTAIICIVSYAIMMLMPYFTSVIPSAFVAVVVGTILEYMCRMHTVTLGHLYKIHGSFPKPQIPQMDWSDSKAVSEVMVASILTALISCIESFMSDAKITQLTETPTNFERESLSLGAAHILNGFFQGMPGCIVYGPCILNIECGAGTRRLSGFICAVLMVIIPLALFVPISIIPMGALSAVLFGVSSKTADYRMLAMIFLQRVSLQESAVAIIVTVVTVVENLAIGAASGFAAALVFFMWNMAKGRVSMAPVFASHKQPISNSNSQDEAALQSSGSRRSSSLDEGSPLARTREEKRAREDSRLLDRESKLEMTPEGAPQPEASRTFSPREENSEDDNISIRITTDDISEALPGAQQTYLNVDLLDIQTDPVYPDIKVLRIKVQGVLFFGSCMSFVDHVIRLLHEHHNQIFLKVSDIILDFQMGVMTVMDFSACEALQDAAKIFAKRGIRTHIQNMDPLSYATVNRCRRYLPDIIEDDCNNSKHICYVRRIFKRTAELVPSLEDGEIVNSGAKDPLDDNVFLSKNQSFVITRREGEKSVSLEPAADEKRNISRALPEREDRVSELAVLSSIEVQLSAEKSVKVGFSIYRPTFGISVVIFDTIAGWKKQIRNELQERKQLTLELGLNDVKPFNRQYGDLSKLFLKRLLGKDVRSTSAFVPPHEQSTPLPRAPGPLRRMAPTHFVQLPRFPGQGFGKKEQLNYEEWNDVRNGVIHEIFNEEPPPPKSRFVCRAKKFQVDLFDGFI